MDDLIDDTFLRFKEPADVFESFGFGLIKQSAVRAPFGTWNIYQTDSIYAKTDLDGNKWSFITKDRCSESGQRITYELFGSIECNEKLNPIIIKTKDKTRIRLCRTAHKNDHYEISGTEIKNSTAILDSLNQLKDDFITINNSNKKLELKCLIEDFKTEKIKSFITTVDQLLEIIRHP